MLLFVFPSLPAPRAAPLSLRMPVFMCVYTSLPSRNNFYVQSVRHTDQNQPSSLSLTDQEQMPGVKESPETLSLLMFYKPETEVIGLLGHPQCVLLSDI